MRDVKQKDIKLRYFERKAINIAGSWLRSTTHIKAAGAHSCKNIKINEAKHAVETRYFKYFCESLRTDIIDKFYGS
jgi:hypothetical protein